MTKATMILFLAVTIAVAACAPHRVGAPAPPAFDPEHQALIAEYARQLPLGSRVIVDRTSGSTVHGTLIRITTDVIVVEPDTRLPEPPMDISLETISQLTTRRADPSVGRAIAVGAAVGAGAALGFFMLLLFAAHGD